MKVKDYRTQVIKVALICYLATLVIGYLLGVHVWDKFSPKGGYKYEKAHVVHYIN